MTDSAAPATAQTFPVPDIKRIFELLPHRYPFLLVDRVISFEPNKRISAYKNVTFNEAFFQGHFPGNPVMPGVLILEALAQAAGILVQSSFEVEPSARPLHYLVKIDKARFNQIVSPGDKLVLEVEQMRIRMRMGQFACRATVDGKEVASAEIMCAERERS